MSKVTCICCDDEIDADAALLVGYGEHEGEAICEACYSDDAACPICNLLFFAGGDITDIGVIGHYSSVTMDNEDWDGVCTELIVSEYANSMMLHHTDRWRGHYSGKLKDYTVVIDSWFGMGGKFPDEKVERIHRKLEVDKDYPQFNMIVAFPRTTNVCSCGIEVYVKDEDVEEFHRWLGSQSD